MPIKKTLRTLLKVPGYADLIFSGGNTSAATGSGLYSSYQDGSRYKKTMRNFDDSKKYVIHFQLYEDGMGLTNPLAPSSSAHSSGMFYFSILNIPRAFNSRNCNKHLIAACNNMDLKNDDGVDVIFDSIIKEIGEFESTGIKCDVVGLGSVRVYGVLAQFTGDNLALNQMFGLIECFSADYW